MRNAFTRGLGGILVVVGCATARAQDLSPRLRVEVIADATSVHLANWDRDGLPDVLVRDPSGELRVFLNDGTGSFQPLARASHLSALGPGKSVHGDFDGDGRTDLGVVRSSGAPEFAFALGLDDGTFGSHASIAIPAGVTDLDVADFDRDGADDIAMVLPGSFAVRMDLTGAVVASSHPYTGWLERVTAADFDGNGRIDLALYGFFQGSSIWTGDGTGSFQFVQSQSMSGIPIGHDFRHRVGDVDGDGKLEFLIGSACFQFDVNWDIRELGKLPPTASPETGFALVDVSGDGRDDILTTDALGQFVWHESFGNGEFGAGNVVKTNLPAGQSLAQFSCVELNGDGVRDFVCRANSRAVVAIRHELDGLGQTALPTASGSVWKTTSTAAADLDGDGDLDLVGINATGDWNATLVTTRNQGAGKFVVHSVVPGISIKYDRPKIQVGDFNGDGDLDALLPLSFYSPKIALGDGAGSLSPVVDLSSLGIFVRAMASADVDLDGDLDLVASKSETIFLLSNDGAAGFTMMNRVRSEMPIAAPLAVAEIDGDGFPDFLMADLLSTFDGAPVYLRRGHGDFTMGPLLSFGFERGPISDLACADVDSDGDDDVAVLRGDDYPPNSVSVFRNDGNAVMVKTANKPIAPMSLLDPIPSIFFADLDADGRLELAHARGTELASHEFLADASFASTRRFLGVDAMFAAVDVTGDGLADLVGGDAYSRGYVPSICNAMPSAHGAGCPGTTDAAPHLVVTGCATPGASLKIRVSSLPPASTALLAFGSSPGSTSAGPCALHVGGPRLVVVPLALLPQSGGYFGAEFDVSVPLAGNAMPTYAQAWIVRSGAMTNGVMIPASP